MSSASAQQESLWTLLDPSLIDAFNVLPVAGLGRFERVAMDHCVSGLGYSNYHFRPRSFPFNALLQASIADPACLHILIAKTAHHLDTLRHLSNPKAISCAIIEPSREILWHKVQGIQMLKKRIAKTFVRPDPLTVQAVLFLAELEDRFGYEDATAIHLDGLRQIVHLFGGFLAFNSYPRLQLQLAWTEITHFAFLQSEAVAGLEGVETQTSQVLLGISLSSDGIDLPAFGSSSFVSKTLRASNPSSNETGYAECMRLNIRLAILFYLYLHITCNKPDNSALAEYSTQIASCMGQYAAPGGEALGVLLWILMMQFTTEQRYDFTVGIAALADPSRTLAVLRLMRLARREPRSSKLALMSALTAKVLSTGD